MAIRLVQLGDLDGLVISGARTTGALLLCDSDDELRELGGLLMAPVRVVAAGSADDDGDGDGESKRLVGDGWGGVVKSSYGFIGPGPGRPGRKTGALEVVLQRALAVLQRDTSVVWRSTDLLRSAGGTSPGTWSRVCARLAKHPDVSVTGNSYGRRYQARRA